MKPEQILAMTRFNDAAACLVEMTDIDTLAAVFEVISSTIGYTVESGAPDLRHLRRLRAKYPQSEAVQQIRKSGRALAEALVVASTASALAGVLRAIGPELYRWSPERQAMCLPVVSEDAVRPLNISAARTQVAVAFFNAISAFSEPVTICDFGLWCRPAVRNPRALAMVANHYLPDHITFPGLLSAPEGLFGWFRKFGFEGDEVFAPLAVLLTLKSLKLPALTGRRDVAALVPFVMAVRVELEQWALDDPAFDITPLVAAVGIRMSVAGAISGVPKTAGNLGTFGPNDAIMP